MEYLYLTVLIFGAIIIPIVVGVVYAKAMKKWEQSSYYSPYYKPDPFDYFMAIFMAFIGLAFWPITLPLALTVGLIYLLFKSPEFFMNRRRAKKNV